MLRKNKNVKVKKLVKFKPIYVSTVMVSLTIKQANKLRREAKRLGLKKTQYLRLLIEND